MTTDLLSVPPTLIAFRYLNATTQDAPMLSLVSYLVSPARTLTSHNPSQTIPVLPLDIIAKISNSPLSLLKKLDFLLNKRANQEACVIQKPAPKSRLSRSDRVCLRAPVVKRRSCAQITKFSTHPSPKTPSQLHRCKASPVLTPLEASQTCATSLSQLGQNHSILCADSFSLLPSSRSHRWPEHRLKTRR